MSSLTAALLGLLATLAVLALMLAWAVRRVDDVLHGLAPDDDREHEDC